MKAAECDNKAGELPATQWYDAAAETQFYGEEDNAGRILGTICSAEIVQRSFDQRV
jgi:hypothetical protein